MQEEIWEDIPNYEGIYQVSSFGRVKSLPKEWISGRNTIKKHNGVMLSMCKGGGGYFHVSLLKDKRNKTFKIHKLVAITFLNHTPNGNKIVVDHINNDKLDNRVENLQLVTNRENTSKDIKNKTSKYTGVCWYKRYGKWRIKIQINNMDIHIGYFDCELKAYLAYQNKLKEISE